MDIKRLMDLGCYRGLGTGGACRSGAADPYERPHPERPAAQRVGKRKKV